MSASFVQSPSMETNNGGRGGTWGRGRGKEARRRGGRGKQCEEEGRGVKSLHLRKRDGEQTGEGKQNRRPLSPSYPKGGCGTLGQGNWYT